MANHLGNYFHQKRIEQGLSLGSLARLVGYRNISKGANRISRFERDGDVSEQLLAQLAEGLEIDLPTVERLIDLDRQEYLREWEEWVAQPVPMEVIFKYLPAVYGRVPFPAEIVTPEEAEAFACDYAKQCRRKVCLAVSRRHSVWINRDGAVYTRTEATPDDSNVPYMRLQGSRRAFLFKLGRK